MEPENTQQTQPSSPAPLKEKASLGPLIGSIIVIVILIVGALYFWMNTRPQMPAEKTTPAASTESTPLSDSTEVGDLEQDILNTPEIDIDLENI